VLLPVDVEAPDCHLYGFLLEAPDDTGVDAVREVLVLRVFVLPPDETYVEGI